MFVLFTFYPLIGFFKRGRRHPMASKSLVFPVHFLPTTQTGPTFTLPMKWMENWTWTHPINNRMDPKLLMKYASHSRRKSLSLVLWVAKSALLLMCSFSQSPFHSIWISCNFSKSTFSSKRENYVGGQYINQSPNYFRLNYSGTFMQNYFFFPRDPNACSFLSFLWDTDEYYRPWKYFCGGIWTE